jgi:RNA polymerase sigma-70 factor (ECF subfamily)
MPSSCESLQQLHAACAAGVFRFLWTLTRDVHAAEDLLQEVFVKLAREGSRHAVADSAQAWVFKLARHAALDWLRRNAVRERVAGQMREYAEAFVTPDDPDAAGMQRELAKALGGLPEEQRAAVHLHLWEGLTFREIAEIHDIPTATAASRYRYGLATLRATLQPLYSELHES